MSSSANELSAASDVNEAAASIAATPAPSPPEALVGVCTVGEAVGAAGQARFGPSTMPRLCAVIMFSLACDSTCIQIHKYRASSIEVVVIAFSMFSGVWKIEWANKDQAKLWRG